MRRARRWSELLDDRGSAALEFIVVGLLLLVPITYLVVALGQIQGQSLGVQAGARVIARAVATAPDAATASERAHRELASIAAEYELDPGLIAIDLACAPAGVACPSAGATVTVTVSTRVALPLVPPVFGADRAASVPVEARATQKVSRFWSGR
ncbi:TadE family protein [Microbacterium sp. X-17]|uniref:TadE/TadG family type IV pilus assembly protein n=1 Tax=Microbacterium sp. X-17 TaxID=3144404 RepID=UPI0031F51EC7